MPSIFFLSLMNGAPWGGSEEIWYRTALHGAHKGWKIGCAAYEWPGKEERFLKLEKAGCTVYQIPNKGRRKRNLAEKLLYKLTKTRQKKFCKQLPFHDYEFVIVNLGGFEPSTKQWGDFYKQLENYTLVFHNYNERASFNSRKAQRLKNWILQARGNLFASARICQVLEKQLDIAIPHAVVFSNPITFPFPPEISPFPKVTNGFVFAMIAALDTGRKAQDHLIKALSLSKWKERNWVLCLYGEGNDYPYLKELIDKENLQEKVFLKGHTNNIQAVLLNTHLVLQITHMDAMPIAVVEAMAMSRPLVVSNIGDMPLWVHENENGWIARNASVEEIDRTLEMAWSNKDQWKRMGEKSFFLFKEKFPTSPEEQFLNLIGVD